MYALLQLLVLLTLWLAYEGVVRGQARITRDEEVIELGPNQSSYIPLGAAHRLENPGDAPLEIIEVQSGDKISEEDIERLDDVYGRAD